MILYKGSFLAMTGESSFTHDHGKRMAWFCLDQNARSYLMSSMASSDDVASSVIPSSTILTFIDTAIQDQRFLFLIIHLVHFAHYCLVHKNPDDAHLKRILDRKVFTTLSCPENHVEACVCLSGEYLQRVKSILGQLGQLQLSDLVVFLIQLAKVIQMMLVSEHSTMALSSFTQTVMDLIYYNTDTRAPSTGILRDPKERTKRLLQWIHENIILTHALLQEYSEEGLGVRKMSTAELASLESSLRQDIVTTLDNLFHRISFDWCVSSPISLLLSLADKRSNTLMSGTSFLQSILAQPRRHVASALRENLCASNVELANYVRIAFSVMNVRVIDLATWFARFANGIHDDGKMEKPINDSETNLNLIRSFTFAVYQLIHMGIVSKSRRSDDIYEKLAMVWVS